MGVDASYLYGYGAEVNEIEWDIDYLRDKYKDRLNEKVKPKNTYSITWGQFIDDLEETIEDTDSYVAELLESIDILFDINYDGYSNEQYITFNHKHIAKLYPDAQLKDLDEVAKLYAKELGIKNVEEIKWIEWGYFS